MTGIRIVEAVLSDGRDHAFPNGRTWTEAEDGSLTILDGNQELLAKVAAGRWLIIGFRDLVAEKPAGEA